MTIDGGLWRQVSLNLAPFGMLTRIENSLSKGTPDVAYTLTRPKPGAPSIAGWIELKAIDEYPTKGSTTIRIEHLTMEQVLFAEDWTAAGGRAFMLLKAPPWTLLFDAPGIRGVFERSVTAGDGPAVARVAAIGKFPTGGLLKVLAG